MPDYQSSLAGQEIENRLLAVPDKADRATLLQVETMMAPQYDATKEYAVDEYCVRGDVLYKCLQLTFGPFYPAHWKPVAILGEISRLTPYVVYEAEWDAMTDAQQLAVMNTHPLIHVLEGSRPSGGGTEAEVTGQVLSVIATLDGDTLEIVGSLEEDTLILTI